jgi:hypothetical protein
MTNKPYLSFVIVGRNDDYGNDFMNRIKRFLRNLDRQTRPYPGIFELVIVEWNPLADYASLAECLKMPITLPTRVITVPKEQHDNLGAEWPVLEFHGKNVGVRRAHGEFVAVTNPDIIFSDDLIAELARRKLRLDTFYRTDRYDFHVDGFDQVADSDTMRFVLENTFVMHGMNGSSSVSVPVQQPITHASRLPQSRVMQGFGHTNACGDFLLAGREVFFTVRGMHETLEHRWHVDSISLMRFMSAKLKQHVFLAPQCIFHQDHPRKDPDRDYGSIDWQAIATTKPSTSWGLANITLPESRLDLA